MTKLTKSEQQSLISKSIKRWPALSRRELIDIRSGLRSELKNPEADREFISKRIFIINDILCKMKT